MNSSQELESMLKEIIDKRIKSVLKDKGFETPYEGVVETIEEVAENTDPYAQYVNVFVVGYNTVVYLRNLSGELLIPGNRVRIYTNNGNLANGYIGIKCN